MSLSPISGIRKERETAPATFSGDPQPLFFGRLSAVTCDPIRLLRHGRAGFFASFVRKEDGSRESGAVAVPEGPAGPAIGFGTTERLEEGIEERGFARFVVADKEGAG